MRTEKAPSSVAEIVMKEVHSAVIITPKQARFTIPSDMLLSLRFWETGEEVFIGRWGNSADFN